MDSTAAEKIYDAEFAASEEELEALADFVAIVRHLRRDCPWDREQTHESVRHLLIEECYEAVEAIDNEDWEELKKELGDVFLHVLFHSRIAEEDGRFTLKEVVEAETEKLVNRHPHVFGDVAVADTDEVKKNWEAIKRDEGEEKLTLDGVPEQLPSLLRAHRMQQKAAGVGFDFADAESAWAKVEEELQEFKQHAQNGRPEADLEDELGDVLFALVNFARLEGLNGENALRGTNNKFRDRFGYIEKKLREEGRTLDEASLDEMETLWNEAKRKFRDAE